MRAKILAFASLAVLVASAANSVEEFPEIVFGPVDIVREVGPPSVYRAEFEARPGEAMLAVVNGDDAGTRRVSSARVELNGETVLGPSDFNRNVAHLTVPIRLESSNALVVELQSKPTSFLTLEVQQELFEEEVPSWNMPDPSIAEVAVEPERADPGEMVEVRATVANDGTGPVGSPTLVVTADDAEILRAHVDPLAPGEQREYLATWTAGEPGEHAIFAELESNGTGFDGNPLNDARTATLRVSGETDPQPEIEMGDIDFGSLQLAAGEPSAIPVPFKNPGFAPVENVPVVVSVDGVPLPSPPGDDRLGVRLDLGPGEEQILDFPWNDVTPGMHKITAAVGLSIPYPDVSTEVQSWCAAIPDETVLHAQPGLDEWASLGPRQLTHDTVAAPVGRIDRVALDEQNTSVLYAGAPAGGLWKTTDGGQTWTPLGDKWPNLHVGAVAVDPRHSEIVYVATGSAWYGGGFGFLKSIDGGDTWYVFASTDVSKGASSLEVRYLDSGELVVYAASDRGILRYRSSDPWATKSAPSEWTVIKSGLPTDMVVSPADPTLVYASLTVDEPSAVLMRDVRVLDGLYRTRNADDPVPVWKRLDSGFPPTAGHPDPAQKPGFLKLDVYRSDPRYVYAAITHPLGVDRLAVEFPPFLGIYRSDDEGDSWQRLYYHYPGNGTNSFLRVHPNRHQIYFGGVKFFTRLVDSFWGPERQIPPVHDDLKDLQFSRHFANTYYVTSDGGVWRCTSSAAGTDSCIPRNSDLRVTMFYDLDASATDSDLMIGGTQDNRTILYQGQPDWLSLPTGGDGLFSLIAPSSNQFMYAQYQSLDSVSRSVDGGKSFVSARAGLPSGYTAMKVDFKASPTDPLYLISGGDQVYWTGTGGAQWSKMGPPGRLVEPAGAKFRGYVSRVAFRPGQTPEWIAGTNQGQIWYTPAASLKWYLLFEHPHRARVNSLAFSPVDPDRLYVSFTSTTAANQDVYVFEKTGSDPDAWASTRITGDFPTGRCTPQVVAGDGYTTGKVYVGTNAGVFRGTEAPTGWVWEPYDDGLPLADVRDLLVDPVSKELRAGTFGRGAWAVETGPTSSDPVDPEIP